jgi:hypothetical protein
VFGQAGTRDRVRSSLPALRSKRRTALIRRVSITQCHLPQGLGKQQWRVYLLFQAALLTKSRPWTCERQSSQWTYPDFRFIGEESYAGGERVELTDEPTFIVDPIDATVARLSPVPSCTPHKVEAMDL